MTASGPLVGGADAAAAALVAAWRVVAATMPGATWREVPGALLWLIGARLPALNGVVAWGREAAAADVARLLDAAEASGVPYSLQLRPGASARLVELAVRRGLVSVEETPLLVCRAGAFRAPSAAPGLVVRLLGPEEVGRHVDVLAAAFDLPAEPLVAVTPPALLAAPGVRVWVGEVDGRPVATAVGVRAGGAVGLSGVATLPSQRRRGYGAAVAAAAVEDALAAGARYAWLQSSGDGDGVYRRLGFRIVEAWPFWVRPRGVTPRPPLPLVRPVDQRRRTRPPVLTGRGGAVAAR